MVQGKDRSYQGTLVRVAGMALFVFMLFALGGAAMAAPPFFPGDATPRLVKTDSPREVGTRFSWQTTGFADSTMLSCEHVGPTGTKDETVLLYWTGTATSAKLSGYQWGVSGARRIYVNGTLVGYSDPSIPDSNGAPCIPSNGYLELSVDPAILVQGTNVIRILGDGDDGGWGLTRLKLTVEGADVNGPQTLEIEAPSSYYANFPGYQGEGGWSLVQVPSSYDGSQPVPLVIALHDWEEPRHVQLMEYAQAAEARGWLLVAPEMHGEEDTGDPGFQGKHAVGSRASQYDVLDVLTYMKANYNVDESRVYLIGRGMGGLTALLVAAKWPQYFAGMVADSPITDLVYWEYDLRTYNRTWMAAVHAECGGLRPYQDPWEYERRSPLWLGVNFRHMPVWILHGNNDQPVPYYHGRNMYLEMIENRADPGQVQFTEITGGHNDRLADFANQYLEWLAQWQRPAQMPTDIGFRRDESGTTWWVTLNLEAADLPERNWASVWWARYDAGNNEINANVEDLHTLGISFDLSQLGVAKAASYVVEDLNRDTGEFTATVTSVVSNTVAVTTTPGSHSLTVFPGVAPLDYHVLQYREGVDGYAGTQDTYVSLWAPDTNYGNGTLMRVRPDGPTNIQSALVKFNNLNIPAGVHVRQAAVTLRMERTGDLNVDDLYVDVYKINRSWTELGATWNNRDFGQPWGAAGLNDVPGDRDADWVDRHNLIMLDDNGRLVGWDIKPIAELWAADPSTNHGVNFRVIDNQVPPATHGVDFVFRSSEDDLADRPLLTIVYSTNLPNPCPEDVNSSGGVSIQDVLLVASLFGTTSGEPDYQVAYDLAGPDGPGADGIINVHDIIAVAGQWGSACS